MGRNKPDFSQIIQNNPSGWILRSDLTEKTGRPLSIHGQRRTSTHWGKGIPSRDNDG